MIERAVAWDIDGTLVDSEGLHHRALMTVSAGYGFPIAADDESFVGIGMDQVWRSLRPRYPDGLNEAEWVAAISAAYVAGAGVLRAIPGALEAMRELQRAGVPQCCVSNSARQIVDINLAVIGALPFLRFSVSRDDVPRGKPDPAPYRLACRRLGLSPASVLAVEDSDPGARSARAAGCPVLRYGVDFRDFGRVLDRVLNLTTDQKE